MEKVRSRSHGTVIRAYDDAGNFIGLRREENFACIGIFYLRSRSETGDVNVTAIWRERTGN